MTNIQNSVHDMIDSESVVEITKTSTGIPTIDRITTGGLGPGDVLGVLGPSGGGKTTMAVQIAVHFAKREGKRVLYLSYENRIRPDLWRRFVGLSSGLSSTVVNKYTSIQEMPKDLKEKVTQEWGEKTNPHIHHYNMLNNKGGSEEIEKILHDIESHGTKIDLVIIDSYQPMIRGWQIGHNSRLSFYEDSQRISMSLVEVADKYKTAMVIFNHKTIESHRNNSHVKVKRGEGQNDKGFDNWIQYCIGLGNHDKNHRFWCNNLKSKNIPGEVEVDGILELHGGFYCIKDVTHMMSGKHDGKEFKEASALVRGLQDEIKAEDSKSTKSGVVQQTV